MKVRIYALITLENNEVIYIGQTKNSLEERLKSHYYKLKEVKEGKRNMTKLFNFLNNYLPNKVHIELLKEIDTDTSPFSADFLEKHYISVYRNINHNLLNEADGGIGGYTIKHKTDKEKIIIGDKISNKLKNRKKPKGFAEHLSKIRKGKNNPAAKKFEHKVQAYKNNILIKEFDYSFEINEFLKTNNAYSNVQKALIKYPTRRPYGYFWKFKE